MPDKLVFLGTGAGDKGMLRQRVRTSSLYFQLEGLRFILDPGPGTIVNANKEGIDLEKLDGLIVSHPHPDHCSDANPLIDALRKDDSFLIAGKKCLQESKKYFPCINKFQQSIPEKVFSIGHGDKFKIKGLTFEAVKNNHLDCGLGIKLMGSKKIGYVGDGSLEGLSKFYSGMDILIFNTLLPHGKKPMRGIHTSIEEVIDFLKLTRPKKAIIQHFSEDMLEKGIDKEAKLIEKETGIETLAAKDGLELSLK